MLMQVLNTAKRIFSRSPSAQEVPSASKDTTPISQAANNDMVTTRRSGGPVEDRTPLKTPRSSARKSKRALEVEDTPTASKRRKESPAGTEEFFTPHEGGFADVQTQHDPEYDSDTIKVTPRPSFKSQRVKEETPGSTKSAPNTQDKLPIRRRVNPRVVIPKKPTPPTDLEVTSADTIQAEQEPSSPEAEFYTPIVQRLAAEPASAQVEEEAEDEEQDGVSTPKAKASTPGRNLRSAKKREDVIQDEIADDSVDALEEEDQPTPTAATFSSGFPAEIPSSTFDSENAGLSTQHSTQDITEASPKPKKTHIRFGSEEPAELSPKKPTPEPTSVPLPETEEYDDASDSDEAPEEVTTASALNKTRAAEEDAARAFAAQQAREAVKRQERADRIASEQVAKKKREEKKAKKLAKKAARAEASQPVTAPHNFNLASLPALLPTELLEAAGDKRPPTPPLEDTSRSAADKRDEKLKRHIRFLERGEQRVKDVKKGKLRVRVLEQENKFLAPKVNRDVKHVREKWLKGRQMEKTGGRGPSSGNGKQRLQLSKMERRPIKSGFVSDED
ncbi:hypothetical protein K491DRAFT_760953 [Lophiostoma macrostomum CBS 122681]|uniref:Uncharacterized protein n=1 Tax=Lophiostoma macrostomum CBS 122681 TaxID=1314788 RepID=A0A6A6SUX6_9PLEO|nr:hypothetical protein K491DRAFT_760953 [Lophiostoma macrostomum CBS 122681]